MDAVLKGSQGSIELDSSIVGVGRSPENQLIVNESQVSWFHAKICPQGQSHAVIDLGSTNGTFVNEQKLLPNIPHRLNVGDTVRFGNTTFSYMTDAFVRPPKKVGVPVIVGGFQQQQSSAQPQWNQQSRPSSSAPPIPNSPPPQQTKKPCSVNQQRITNKSNRKKIAWFGGLIALIGALTPIIVALIQNAHWAPPTPMSTPVVTQTAQIPPLHATYSGSLVNNGTDYTLNFTGLTEFKDGSFQTTGGNIGYCYATFSGKVSSTGSITFTGQQLAGGPYNCGAMTADFSGQVNSDGSHLSGTWQAQNTSPPQSGNWNLA